MSAALVESVRDTVDAEESVEIHRVHGTPGVPPLALISRAQMLRAKLDLPAILAALTEAEALKAEACRFYTADGKFSVLLSPEDVVAARKAAAVEIEALRAQVAAGQAREVALREAVEDSLLDGDKSATTGDERLDALLSAPTDTAALRAFGERCVLAALGDERIDYRGDDVDCPANVAAQSVDRVLGGS